MDWHLLGRELLCTHGCSSLHVFVARNSPSACSVSLLVNETQTPELLQSLRLTAAMKQRWQREKPYW